MKKILFVLAGLIAVTAINAQTLSEIVKNYSVATKQDKLASVKTIKITAKMSAMGMEMPMIMYMKNPNKVKTVISFNGQDMTTAYDGEKGFMINPMMGSTDPVELTGAQLKQAEANNTFNNQIQGYFKSDKLSLEGQENVNDKPAFKLKANDGPNPIYLYLDKSSYMLVKINATVDQMGTQTNVDTFMSDYTEIDGVILPKKTTVMSNGMEAAVLTYDKIEVNIPIEDSVFKLK